MEGSEEVIENICSYAERHAIKELLQEYMKRVVLHRPTDVKAFLIETIEREPYTPKSLQPQPMSKGGDEPALSHS